MVLTFEITWITCKNHWYQTSYFHFKFVCLVFVDFDNLSEKMNLYKFIGHFGALLPNEDNGESCSSRSEVVQVEVKYGKRSSNISSVLESDRRFWFVNHLLLTYFSQVLTQAETPTKQIHLFRHIELQVLIMNSWLKWKLPDSLQSRPES